jgi:hypothetical protein
MDQSKLLIAKKKQNTSEAPPHSWISTQEYIFGWSTTLKYCTSVFKKKLNVHEWHHSFPFVCQSGFPDNFGIAIGGSLITC